MELKEAGESQDLDSFGMLENNNSDDLLLQIAVVEAEWNALTIVFSMQECKGAYKKLVEQEDK